MPLLGVIFIIAAIVAFVVLGYKEWAPKAPSWLPIGLALLSTGVLLTGVTTWHLVHWF